MPKSRMSRSTMYATASGSLPEVVDGPVLDNALEHVCDSLGRSSVAERIFGSCHLRVFAWFSKQPGRGVDYRVCIGSHESPRPGLDQLRSLGYFSKHKHRFSK